MRRPPTFRRVLSRLKAALTPDANRFLRSVTGVIHVGANTGQEREFYDKFGLRVLWIEPIPAVFEALEANLSQFPRQRAVRALVTDRDGQEYAFNVACNNGASSSILELKHHKDIWPDVGYTETLQLKSVTLASLFASERLDPTQFDALIMDTQGSELLVLQGGMPLLRHFKFIKTEVPDFEAYTGCCQLADIEQFMKANGFCEFARDKFADRRQGGAYYDVTYKRRS